MTYYIALPLIAFGVNISLFVLVFFSKPSNPIRRSFSVVLAFMAFWGLSISGMRSSPTLQDALFWEKLTLVCLTGVSLMFWRFTQLFTGKRVPKAIDRLVFLTMGVFMLLAVPGWVVQGMQQKSYGYAPLLGPFFYLFFVVLYVAVVWGVLNLVRAYATSTSPQDRNRLIYVISGAVVASIGSISDILPVFGLPIYPMGIPANIIWGILTTVSITRHGLLEIQLIIRRGVLYFVFSFVVFAFFLVALLSINYLLGVSSPPSGLGLVLLFLIVFATLPLFTRFQTQIDRWFYRERYDYLRGLETFSRKTSGVLDSKALSNELASLLMGALHTENLTLFLLRPEIGDYEAGLCFGFMQGWQPRLNKDSALVAYMKAHEGFLNSEDLETLPQFHALTAAERAILRDLRGKLYVPLKTKGQLVGVLVLGAKKSQIGYSDQELNLIGAVTQQVSVHLENAQLYELERRSRLKLEQEQQTKSDFLLAVAHEFRTPLTAVKTSASLLTELVSAPEDSPQMRLIGSIRRSEERLEKRLSDLLDLSRIQASQLRLNQVPTELRDVVHGSLNICSPIAQSKRQTISLDLPSEMPMVLIDSTRVEQVITNVLSNAIKYTNPGGKISIRVTTNSADAVVEISDTGVGIPKEEQANIFDPYFRGKSTQVSTSGLGLGLAISKSLVELHGGRMDFSTEVGKGTTFRFTLPLSLQV